jgi:hypothetical protein
MDTWVEPIYVQARESVPASLYSDATVSPLDAGSFVAAQLHQSYHHFIKVGLHSDAAKPRLALREQL